MSRETFKSFFKFIKKIDRFGVTLSFKYDSKATYKTILGMILTFIIIILFIYKLAIGIKDVVKKENLRVKYEEIITDDDNIELKNLKLVVCNYYNYKYDDKQFEKHFSYEYSKNKIQDDLNVNVEKIKLEICKNHKYVYFNNRCMCMNFNETYFYSVMKSPDLIKDENIKVDIKMNFSFLNEDNLFNSNNQNKTNNDELIKIRELKEVLIFYPKYFVNTTNFFNPIEFSASYSKASFKKGSVMSSTMITTKLEVDIINDFYAISNPKIETLNSYTFYKEPSIIYESDDQNSGIITLILSHSSIIKKYSIYSFSFENFIALFGAYFNAMFLFFNIISNLFNGANLNNYIENKFRKKDILVKEVLDEIEKYINNKNLSNNLINNKNLEEHDDTIKNINLGLDKYKENIILDNYFDGNPKIINNNKIQINTFQDLNVNKNSIENFEIDSPSKSFKLNKSYDNTSNNVKKGLSNFMKSTYLNNESANLKLQVSKYDDDKNKINIKKCKNNLNSKFITLREEFISTIDYEKFYYFIKELKLLEFILLDYETLSLLNKIKNIPFSFTKLEQFQIDKLKLNATVENEKAAKKSKRFEKGVYYKFKILKEFLDEQINE